MVRDYSKSNYLLNTPELLQGSDKRSNLTGIFSDVRLIKVSLIKVPLIKVSLTQAPLTKVSLIKVPLLKVSLIKVLCESRSKGLLRGEHVGC